MLETNVLLGFISGDEAVIVVLIAWTFKDICGYPLLGS